MVSNVAARHAPEQLELIEDPQSGLQGVIAIHSTRLGPAAGGCRLWRYAGPNDAVVDACRLAEGMSYKNALAGLPFGGGKAVLRRPAGAFDRRTLFEAFGRAVADLGGGYVTAEDVGTTVEDMAMVSRRTRHVAGLPHRPGAVGGDPSPWTARGVFLAMQVAVQRRLGRSLAECTVAVQGVGHVGGALARLLHDAGAELVLADVEPAAVARTAAALGARAVPVDEIASCPADVFAPCALGGVLDQSAIGRLAATVVCGAANNQLRDAADAALLADRSVLYAPDFVVNAGGIINVAAEYLGWSPGDVADRIEAIPLRLAQVLDFAMDRGVSTHDAAEEMARQVIAAGPGPALKAA